MLIHCHFLTSFTIRILSFIEKNLIKWYEVRIYYHVYEVNWSCNQCNLVNFFKTFIINPFHATGLFLYPLKTSENVKFLMFSGGIERDQWHKMDYWFWYFIKLSSEATNRGVLLKKMFLKIFCKCHWKSALKRPATLS